MDILTLLAVDAARQSRMSTTRGRLAAAVLTIAGVAVAGTSHAQTDGGTVSVSVGDDDRVRIEVPSAADRYHVLYYRPAADDPDTEYAVALHRGAAGSVVLSEPLRVESGGAYRVATYSTAAPGDVDGDGTDDLAELGRAEASSRAPLSPATPFAIVDGAVAIPDLATFQTLSYDRPSSHLEHVKFILADVDSDAAAVYYMNTDTWRGHLEFALWAFGWKWRDLYRAEHIRGEIVYHPYLMAPNGEAGTFRFIHIPWESRSFEQVARSLELIAASMPFLRNNLVYHPRLSDLARYEREKASYDASRVPVYLYRDLATGLVFHSMNAAVGYGFLRVLDGGERPTFRDVVILRRLPNELSAVAGVITLEPQTPLSHVNLRAAQDGVPNAYIGTALDDPAIAGLIGKYVRFEVTANPGATYSITEATAEQVASHHESRRPSAPQTPARDLSVTDYRDLDDIGFGDADAFGVKATNLAVLRTLGLADVEVPDGFALPFHFYDEFMKHNGFYDDIDAMLADAAFRATIATRDAELKKLRRRIENGAVSTWMGTSLAALHGRFPTGTAVRCRSSSNNEDLPGFSGAGLYDSYTHHPTEGDLSKSVKQVFASLWNLRAFEEREFHRVDHKAAAMGVLLHPNFSDEQANGVAVSDDPIYGAADAYYVNAQVGEELVTNPSAFAVPEELLLGDGEDFAVNVVRRSNLVADDARVLSAAHIATLHGALGSIHTRFETLYDIAEDAEFSMEIEFKVTAANKLAIKQARPWIY